ncbi:MAG: DMSO reductase [Sulfobacillus thermosulfidooxidans]|uniref:DMSO reductase n=1 Tax=Sulfobacillus thermosulfidooxidans TaxID=28034 RepID=A0A2T2WX93_SULTH|nr:MAG: DMSO reductase [Sulfobacillus thermosulfidooxidans]
MRPTWPLLALTLLQGLSVGLMSIAAILLFTQPHDPKMIFILQGTAFITGGIGGLSSIFHMHRLQGAKYVLRRLKTSWLSREALSTGLYMMVVALTVLVHLVALPLSGLWQTLSVIAAVFGVAAVYITAMLYATIRAMRSWHSPLTVLMFFGAAALSGTLWAWGISGMLHENIPGLPMALMVVLVITAVLKALQIRNFREAEHMVMSSTGTGLSQKPYRVMDTGTTKPPYRHQTQIWPALTPAQRAWGYGLMGLLLWGIPVILLVASPGFDQAVVALVSGSLGLMVERWMFFGDATHSSRVWFADEPKRPSQVAR